MSFYIYNIYNKEYMILYKCTYSVLFDIYYKYIVKKRGLIYAKKILCNQ